MKEFTAKDIIKIKRKSDARKGDAGRILIIGGSNDYIGAPLLSGLAALRSGTDWVTIAAPEKVAWAINSQSPDIITRKFQCEHFDERHESDLLELTANFDVIQIGNGIGNHPSTLKMLQSLIPKIEKPKVIDADALRCIQIKSLKKTILTPHKGEFAALLKNNNHRADLASLPIREIGSAISDVIGNSDTVFLIKGKTDLIAAKDRIVFNDTGNSAMSIAGTGDVLAGITSSFLGQTKNPFYSASFAAYINGIAGDLLYKKMGVGFLASEIIPILPLILKNHRIVE